MSADCKRQGEEQYTILRQELLQLGNDAVTLPQERAKRAALRAALSNASHCDDAQEQHRQIAAAFQWWQRHKHEAQYAFQL